MVSRSRTGLAAKPPRHVEVARKLERYIKDTKVERGSRILGERKLSELFDVSRVTLRKALQELRDKGMLVADEAKGWFVTSTSLEEKNVLRSFTELARAQGFKAHSIVLSAETRMTRAEEAEILRSPAGTMIFEVERVRCVGGEPIGLEKSRVTLARCPGIETADLETASIHELLRKAGAAPASADYVLCATSANADQAEKLRLPQGFPLLSAEAITRDRHGHVIEMSTTVFRGDRYRFHTTLLGKS